MLVGSLLTAGCGAESKPAPQDKKSGEKSVLDDLPVIGSARAEKRKADLRSAFAVVYGACVIKPGADEPKAVPSCPGGLINKLNKNTEYSKSHQAVKWDGKLANVPKDGIGFKMYGEKKFLLASRISNRVLCMGTSFTSDPNTSGNMNSGTMTRDNECPVSVDEGDEDL